MAAPLLTTKLYIPPVRPELVERPRLTDRLSAGVTRKLTLVSAPAGFGKTTLVSAWVQQSERPAAWLSLDEGDNDPVRFWTYLVAALQIVRPGLGENALAMFKSSRPVPIDAVLTTLINEIAAFVQGDHGGDHRGDHKGDHGGDHKGRPYVLVLDDYHVVAAPPVHEALAFLLDNLPPQMHVVITTRVDPPLPLARLRARGQMTEIRVNDLRFTPEEAAAFLERATGLVLSPPALSALEERTEGWIAGLQMASLAVQGMASGRGQGDVDRFIEAFAGSHRYILDYLLEEVLNREPKDVRAFLLQTSILGRLTGPLCDAVTDGDGGQDRLERLEDANLFIVPLDYDRNWYRYHRLFADLLYKQLSESQPDVLPMLHRRASRWHEQNGLLVEAVGHALAAGDVERAAGLIERSALEMLDRGEVMTFVGWLDALPDEAIRSRPWLCVLHAWMLILSGRAEAIESRLRDAEGALGAAGLPDEGEADRIRGYISAIRAQVAFIGSAIPSTIELAYDALEKLPETDHGVRATTVTILGAAHVFVDDFAAAARSFEEAKLIGQASGNNFNVMLASSALAQLAVVQGRLREAERICRDALRLVEEPIEHGRSPGVGYAYVGLADVLCERNDLEEASRYAEEGVELCKLLGQAEILMNGYVALARVRRACGDLDGALAVLQEASRVASEMSVWSVAAVAVHQARLWLARGDVAAASRWAQESGLGVDDGLGFHREAGHLTLARVLVAQGELDGAAGLLARLLEAAEAAGRWGSAIEILVLQALVSCKRNETDSALDALGRALSLAEPEGYVRVFLDEGEPVVELLRQAAARGIAPAYVDKLLRASGVCEYERVGELPAPPTLVEPLSERELEVLRLVAAGLSNREIAEHLYVSINTVKAHTKGIYRKLDVHSRTQAVNRAGELNLL